MHIGYFSKKMEAQQAIANYRERMGWPLRKGEIPTQKRKLNLFRSPLAASNESYRSPSDTKNHLEGSEIEIGMDVDAKDKDGRWCAARVVEIKCREKGRQSFAVLVHFKGWNKRFDTWLPLRSIARIHTHSRAMSVDKKKTRFEVEESDEEDEDDALINHTGDPENMNDEKNDEVEGNQTEEKNESTDIYAQGFGIISNKRPRPDYIGLPDSDTVDSHTPESSYLSDTDSGTPRHGIYIGIWPQRKRWRACISHNGQRMHLGSYPTAEKAARAWDAKARELRGENTKTNFPLVEDNTGTKESESAPISSKIPSKPSKKKPGRKPRGLLPTNCSDSASKKVKTSEIYKGPTEGVQALAKPKPSVPWVDDLTPRSRRRAKPKNYRLMEKGNFNEVFALQLKAFRLRAKQQARAQAAAAADRDEEGGENGESSQKKRSRNQGHEGQRSRLREHDLASQKKKKDIRVKSPAVSPSPSSRSRSPLRRSPRRGREGLRKVGSGSGMFSRGEILAIFAGASSVDGEAFWLFECGQPSDGAYAMGFYYRKDEQGGGRYERDPAAPRQKISVDSVMRDFNGHYVTFKQRKSPPQRYITLSPQECNRLHKLAGEIIRMQGISVPSGANTVADDDLLAPASTSASNAGLNTATASESLSSQSIERTPDDVLGLGELPMQLRTFFAEDPVNVVVSGLAASGAAVTNSTGAANSSDPSLIFSGENSNNVMLSLGNANTATISSTQSSTSEVVDTLPPIGNSLNIFSDADGDKVASMFLS
eukprot:CAMPEP_0184498014 /NCGR_PEP_ID=MMETSP0113_2-20130426/37934_1 /TAXON_ID=91329 /ORGANISM="Norrisiella sphaerica, Strain BC52" /LENGTH=765 /DNA_ID=CAMNT_0026885359 /DNA_START=24 /DNA_END=2321 /DNA_ORIENTATION=+